MPIPLGQESARILLPVLLMAGLIRKYEYVKSTWLEIQYSMAEKLACRGQIK